jgi:predicted secreted protein
VVQIPCPETSYVGLKRWWFTKELYDSVSYRRHCRRIAKAVSELG